MLLNHSMFELASGYKDHGMAAYSELQQAEFETSNMAIQQQDIREK